MNFIDNNILCNLNKIKIISTWNKLELFFVINGIIK